MLKRTVVLIGIFVLLFACGRVRAQDDDQVVTAPTHKPELGYCRGAEQLPTSTYTGSQHTICIEYRDVDGDPPEKLNLIIKKDKEAPQTVPFKPESIESTDYSHGIIHTWKDIPFEVPGKYEISFYAKSVDGQVYYPSKENIIPVTVEWKWMRPAIFAGCLVFFLFVFPFLFFFTVNALFKSANHRIVTKFGWLLGGLLTFGAGVYLFHAMAYATLFYIIGGIVLVSMIILILLLK